MNKLTQEQQKVVDTVLSATDERIIAVNSIAGSGKTSTASAVINAYKPKNGFYTAFNKAIVTDSSRRFGSLLDCKTIHALAYSHIKPSKGIEDLTYLSIKEPISYEAKAKIIEIIDDFYRSSSLDINNFSASRTDNEDIQQLVFEYTSRMLEGKIPVTFNYMLKCLHLMLAHKEIEIDYDLLILDECQDTTAVTLEIFKLMQANRKVMFGDKFQNIYSFMNTLNAFEELNDLNLIRLTKSFRCNPHIADIVEQFGTSYLEDDFMFKGNEDIDGTPKSMAYISRTNAALIERMHELLNKGVTFSLTRHVNDIFALPIAVANAACGNVVYDKKYKYLETEYRKYSSSPKTFKSFYEHLIYTVDDVSITNTIKTLMSFANKRINIFKLKEDVKKIRSNPNIILTTAHAFKGLEADMVHIEDDLNSSVNKTIQMIKDATNMFDNEFTINDFLTSSQKEDLNTYYVALSRARSAITNVNYIG